MKHNLWEVEKDLRANLPLRLCRVETYSRTGDRPSSYSTELQCLGKYLKIAPVQSVDGAKFALDGWVKLLDPIMSKYEINPPSVTVKKIDSPDAFIQAVIQSTKYKEGYKDE